MKHKTWFRLVIKAIGLLLIGFAAPELAGIVAYFVFVEIPTMPNWDPSRWTYSVVGPALQLGLGFYLVFDGKWVVNKVIPSNRPYCPECGYDLSKSSSPNCPECGVELPAGQRSS